MEKLVNDLWNSKKSRNLVSKKFNHCYWRSFLTVHWIFWTFGLWKSLDKKQCEKIHHLLTPKNHIIYTFFSVLIIGLFYKIIFVFLVICWIGRLSMREKLQKLWILLNSCWNCNWTVFMTVLKDLMIILTREIKF